LLEARPAWLLPLAALATVSLLSACALDALLGGRELADDAPALLDLARRPFVLFSSYVETRTGTNWGSFPPLLPIAFGALVRPFAGLSGDFWAIRLGVLAWTGLLLVALAQVLERLERADASRTREALFVFALLPSVFGPVAFLPQEESYVALFPLALYAAARRGHGGLVPALLVATALAAKYFVLVIAAPLAFATSRPWRRLVAFGALVAGVLAAYVGYHWLRFGLTPILSHRVEPTMSISLFGLLWHAGLRPPLPVVSLAGAALAGGAAVAFSAAARARGVALPFAMAGTLYAALLTLSITAPAYVLWAIPLALVCYVRVADPRRRLALVALLVAWAAGEWTANLARGTALALASERGAAKSAFAARVVEVVGPDFPFRVVHLAAIALVLASGVGTLWWLWRAGVDDARAEPRAAGARSA
jgi:hypothetical protein